DGEVSCRRRQCRAFTGDRGRRAAGGHAHGAGVLAAHSAVAGQAGERDRVTGRGEPAVGGARVDAEATVLAAVHGDGVAVGVEILPRGRRGDGEVLGRLLHRGTVGGERDAHGVSLV